MFNRHDISRDACQLFGKQAAKGYDWWWHSFTGHDVETGQEKQFFIEFFLCNPESGRDRPVFGQTKANRNAGVKPSYLMVKAGAWGRDAAQLHKFYGWKKIEVDYATPFSISAGDFFLSETGTKGSINITEEEASKYKEWMCQSGQMAWSLIIDKKVAFNVGYGAGKLFRRLQLFEMFWHAEGMKTEYKGEVIWNGRKYKVTPGTSFGYADKNWGKDFTSPWVWLSSCKLKSEITGRKLRNSVFDIGGGRPKIGPFALDCRLLSAFWYEGRPFEFNFSKFWTFCRTRFKCGEGKTNIFWHIEQKTLRDKMVVDVTCKKRDMLLVNYEAPDGSKKHRRLWNGGNGTGTIELYHDGKLVDRIHAENIGCEYGEFFKPKAEKSKQKPAQGAPAAKDAASADGGAPKPRKPRKKKRRSPKPAAPENQGAAAAPKTDLTTPKNTVTE